MRRIVDVSFIGRMQLVLREGSSLVRTTVVVGELMQRDRCLPTWLMESIVVDADVPCTLSNCCHIVRPAMTDEFDQQPAHMAAFPTLEQGVNARVVCYLVGPKSRMSLLAAQLSISCTGILKVIESL